MEIAETFQSQLWIFLNFIFFKRNCIALFYVQMLLSVKSPEQSSLKLWFQMD